MIRAGLAILLFVFIAVPLLAIVVAIVWTYPAFGIPAVFLGLGIAALTKIE